MPPPLPGLPWVPPVLPTCVRIGGGPEPAAPPPVKLTAAPGEGVPVGARANDGAVGPVASVVVVAVVVEGGRAAAAEGLWRGDPEEDSFESELLRSEAISTMTVSRRDLPRRAAVSWAPKPRALEMVRLLPCNVCNGL